jgi:ATP-dependent protease Clp ATPase subunit
MNFLLTGNIQKTDESGNHQTRPATKSPPELVVKEATNNVSPTTESQLYPNSNVVVDEPETPTNAFVDKLTMEYMMNRTHYKKYLAKTDTNKYQRLNEQLLYIQSHEEDIEEITSNLLQDFIRHGNFTKYNTIINTAFEEFLYSCVGYIKDTEYNNKNTDENI